MKRIYIAGPYTQGDVGVNMGRALSAANYLIEHGFAPFVPHLFHFLHMMHPQSYEVWLEQDMVWLAQCDALLRLSGDSPGADREVYWARTYHVPVYDYDSINDLLEAMK
jgi:nucleoside 2-deoxyribosyltransferase